MVKKQIILLGLCITMMFAGCGNLAGDAMQEEVDREIEETYAEENIAPEDAEPVTDEETDTSKKESPWQEDVYSATVLEDEDFIYLCGSSRIEKINKNSNASEIIWEKEENNLEGYDYEFAGNYGILLNDKIYFLEKIADPTWGGFALEHFLSVVNTNGSGYEQIENISGENGECLFVQDGVLYFDASEGIGYKVNGLGELLTDEKVVVSVDDVMQLSYSANGYRRLSPMESLLRYDYYIIRDEDKFCILEPETGERKNLTEETDIMYLSALTNEQLLFTVSQTDNPDSEAFYLVDSRTLEGRVLLDYKSDIYPYVITMDDEYLYLQWYMEENQKAIYQYERVNLATGERTELFTQEEYIFMEDSPQNVMDISVVNDSIYYAGEQDYNLYVMRRNVDAPEKQEVLGEAFVNTGISDVGSVKTYKETIYSTANSEAVTGTIDLKWLTVDERFPGASAINKVLEDSQQGNITYEREMAKEAEEWVDEYGGVPYSFTSNLSEIYYFDGNYLSFCEQNYDYMGGAHGMPYWIGYTFDLQSGKQLYLSDIVANDEASVKDLVSGYFTEMYNENPDAYWEDAIGYVYEYTMLESPFYLTKDGIVFWFEPYSLAPYAAGTQEILVPYSEFDLKLPLGY